MLKQDKIIDKDEVLKMARQAGFPFNKYGLLQGDEENEIDADALFVAFAKLVAEREREACIQIVENEAYQYSAPVWAFEIVNAIKDRGEQHES